VAQAKAHLRRTHDLSTSLSLVWARCALPTLRSVLRSWPMSDSAKPAHIALLGTPIEIGASKAGTLMGPDALRTAGIARLLDQLRFSVEDHGDLAISKVATDG